MVRRVALKSIKIGKLGIENLEQVLQNQEIITRNKIWSSKDILMRWLFTKIHFFLDT